SRGDERHRLRDLRRPCTGQHDARPVFRGGRHHGRQPVRPSAGHRPEHRPGLAADPAGGDAPFRRALHVVSAVPGLALPPSRETSKTAYHLTAATRRRSSAQTKRTPRSRFTIEPAAPTAERPEYPPPSHGRPSSLPPVRLH